ncbi:hypothetical protein, partial [Streptomyces albidoflavus]|uniref:hypothetical protein n=1 Tax=Streptomyces albidoflavus TaxID=1886 RepID=UPI003528A5E6
MPYRAPVRHRALAPAQRVAAVQYGQGGGQAAQGPGAAARGRPVAQVVEEAERPAAQRPVRGEVAAGRAWPLYTSDAADERIRAEGGGRRRVTEN